MSKLEVLRCPVQTYHWGKTGERSLVGRLSRSGGHTLEVIDTTPYAELWMGTHSSKPSLLQDGKKLTEVVNGQGLSFLLKVLSVETALSIQAHPDKVLARELRARDPDHYPDSNHKPEVVIALTKFEALCCFRPLDQINAFVLGIPELCEVVGPAPISCKEDLRRAFIALMTSPREIFEPALEKLLARLADPDASEVVPDPLRDVLLRVSKQYPGDIGLFNLFFFNYLILEPGEAVFLDVNEPHAYLNGDCIECMATSDNVVRAGLTPKFKDIDTLVSMLSYEPAKDPRLQPESIDNNVARFRPPVDDFAVMRFSLKSDSESAKLQLTKPSGSILIIIEGSGKLVSNGSELEVHEGSVVFIPAGCEVSAQGKLLLFQAYTP